MKRAHQVALALLFPSIVATGAFLSILLLPQSGLPSDSTIWAVVSAFIIAGATVFQPVLVLACLSRVNRREETGMEEGVIPDHLSFLPAEGDGAIPVPRHGTIKPWIVNLIFSGDPEDFDENGFYATVLDLMRRGVVKLEKDERGQGILLIAQGGPNGGYPLSVAKDPYEQQVLEYLREIGPKGVVGPEEIRGMVAEGKWYRRVFRLIKGEERGRCRGAYPDATLVRSVSRAYFIGGKERLLPFALNAMALYTVLLFYVGAIGAAHQGNANPVSLLLIGGFLVPLWIGWIDSLTVTSLADMDRERRANLMAIAIIMAIFISLVAWFGGGYLTGRTSVFHSGMIWMFLILSIIEIGIILLFYLAFFELTEPGTRWILLVLLLLLSGILGILVLPVDPLFWTAILSSVALLVLLRYSYFRKFRLALPALLMAILAGIPAIAFLLQNDGGVYGVINSVPLLNILVFSIVIFVYLMFEILLLFRVPSRSVTTSDPARPDPSEKYLVLVAISTGLFTFASFGHAGVLMVLLPFLMILQFFLVLAFPSSLLGQWIGDSYRQKREWDSFRRMIADFAMVKSYAPQDLGMWGDWLIYGTALGAGENVTKAMRELGFELPPYFLPPEISEVLGPGFRFPSWWNRFWGA